MADARLVDRQQICRMTVVLVRGIRQRTVQLVQRVVTLLSFLDADDADAVSAATGALAATIRATGGRLRIEKIDGVFAVGTPLGDALAAAGFAATPQGLRLRS